MGRGWGSAGREEGERKEDCGRKGRLESSRKVGEGREAGEMGAA